MLGADGFLWEEILKRELNILTLGRTNSIVGRKSRVGIPWGGCMM